MWPYEQIQENEIVSSTLNDAEEVDSLTAYASSPPIPSQYMPIVQRFIPAMAPGFVSAIPSDDSESESDDDELEDDSPDPPPSCKPVELLLLKSLDPYVLAVRADEELRTTRILRPPLAQVLWPRRRNRARALLQSSSASASAPMTRRNNESSSQNRVSNESSSSMSHNSIEYVASSSNMTVSDEGSSSESSSAMRRLHFARSMPQPSLLATQAANRVIKFARCARSIYEEDLCCLNCGLFPVSPVTGECGHTRCAKCVQNTARCPCGKEFAKLCSINILVRDIIKKKTVECSSSELAGTNSHMQKIAVSPEKKILNGVLKSSFGPVRTKRRTRQHSIAPFSESYQQFMPMSARARFAYALQLLENGKHKDAAPQLAMAAASYYPDLRVARSLLAQVIMVLCQNRDPRSLTRELNHSVRQLSSTSWIKTDDMECILCCEIFTEPVTTLCGHMFCRFCLEKTLDYNKRCPLCLHDLCNFNLTETNDTIFVKAALASVNALNTPKPMDDDHVPIFVCTVAFPAVSCPLFVFDPRYWSMIRRVLETGSRRFGMVAMDREKKYADYGTILEVCDCVRLEDGRSILSTIGVSRFKVIERSIRDGCDVARIIPIHDIPPGDGVAMEALKQHAAQLLFRAVLWLTTLDSQVLADIENSFGILRVIAGNDQDNEEWWESPDGPAWLWWLIAILPLRMEIKILILSTDCLSKRMLAVSRTLDAIDQAMQANLLPGQYQMHNNRPLQN